MTAVTPDSPAFHSQLKVGDVILEYDGSQVDNDSQLVTQVSLSRVNHKVQVKVFRAGRYHTVDVVIRDRKGFASK